MKLAYVGLPCQLQALRKLQFFSEDLEQTWADSVNLSIGLFCRENWAYTCFRAMVEDDFGVKLNEVEKFDIKKGKIIGKTGGKTILKIPLPESKPFVRIGCKVCLDFSGELCDLSVGAVGTPPKTSTVIVRTARGMELLKAAGEAGYVDIRHIDDVKPGVKLVKKLTDDKREESLEEAQQREKAGYVSKYISTMGINNTEIIVEEAKTKSFADMEKDVIDAGMCVSCGTCVSVSPDKLKMDEERPKLRDKDSKTLWKSYLACPRTSLPVLVMSDDLFRHEENVNRDSLGHYIDIFAVRVTEKAGLKKWQDGGAVTALLAYAMNEGMIDEVISAKHKYWKPEPAVSKNLEELYNSAGTIYSYATNMPVLREEAEK